MSLAGSWKVMCLITLMTLGFFFFFFFFCSFFFILILNIIAHIDYVL